MAAPVTSNNKKAKKRALVEAGVTLSKMDLGLVTSEDLDARYFQALSRRRLI
jgi:hypothetical protein